MHSVTLCLVRRRLQELFDEEAQQRRSRHVTLVDNIAPILLTSTSTTSAAAGTAQAIATPAVADGVVMNVQKEENTKVEDVEEEEVSDTQVYLNSKSNTIITSLQLNNTNDNDNSDHNNNDTISIEINNNNSYNNSNNNNFNIYNSSNGQDIFSSSPYKCVELFHDLGVKRANSSSSSSSSKVHM
jgi:hypothetical protein